jgi:hypothetical protein
MKAIVSLLGFALLSACASDKKPDATGPTAEANTITFNNFDAGGGWSNDPGRNDPTLLDKGRAHSGQYAIKVDPSHEFSLTYDMVLGQLASHKFKTVRLNAWVFMPSNRATGVLVLQVMKADKNEQVYGDGIKLGETVKTYNEWVAVSKDFDLPNDIAPGQHLRLSLWRADASDIVLADDVKLSIVK